MVDFMKKHADAKIVQTFGGTQALATALGETRQTVHNWTVRGISPLGRYKIRDYAKKIRVRLPEGFI